MHAEQAIQQMREICAPMNLIWKELPVVSKYPNDAHLQGLTVDGVAGVDVLMTDTAIRSMTIITPISPAYTPMVVWLTAAIANVERTEADQWLGKVLRQLLVQKRSKETQSTINQIRGVASITSMGVFTLQLLPR